MHWWVDLGTMQYKEGIKVATIQSCTYLGSMVTLFSVIAPSMNTDIYGA